MALSCVSIVTWIPDINVLSALPLQYMKIEQVVVW